MSATQSSSQSDDGVTEHKATISSQSSERVTEPSVPSEKSKRGNAKARKAPAPKSKVENKNKEFTFTFTKEPGNYLDFLSLILTKHGFGRYTPVVNPFTIKMGVDGKKTYVMLSFVV